MPDTAQPVSRLRAIWCALWFGIRPWWMYEDEPHHDGSYWAHLWLNLRYAVNRLLRRETAEDLEFEERTNAS